MSLCHYSTQWWLLPNCWVWWRGGAAVLAWCCRWRGPRTGWQPRQNPALGPATLPPHLRCAALQSRTTARWAPPPTNHPAILPHHHIPTYFTYTTYTQILISLIATEHWIFSFIIHHIRNLSKEYWLLFSWSRNQW